MASNIDLSGLDLSQPNQQPASKPASNIDLSTVNFNLDDVDFSGIGNETAVTEPEKEDSWGDVIYKSLSAMPERMQRSWQGIKQGVAVKGQDLTDGVLAERLRNDPSYAAELGIDPATFTAAEGDTYATKLQKNKALYAAIDKAKTAELNKDADFVAARNEGLRLSNEIAKTAPKTGDEWSAKNLVSTILTGAQDMSPAILTSILLKRPVAGLAEMTGQAYGSYYQDSIDKGLSPAEADNRATVFAALEPVTEAVPLGLIMKKGASSLTDLGKSALAEGIQESATQAIQNAYDIGVLDEDMTVGQFLNDMAFSGVTGAGVGGVLHGAVQAPGMVKDWKDNRSVNNAIGNAEAESGQAVEGIDPNEYDAVRAEMGADPLDTMVEQVAPVISEARRSAYMEARARGMSPSDAMAASRDVGEVDAMDQMVSELFDSPDSVYYANKASATNAPPSVADMVQQQIAQGDMGPLPGETKGLPSPGQTSTIAMPGPVGQLNAATRYNPRGAVEESPVLPPQVTKAVVPPPLPPQIDVAAALEPTAAEVKPKSTLFTRTKKKAAPEVDTEALAAEEARQAELKAKGDEAVAKYIARESVRPPLPGKKPPALQVTNKILKEANERGVDIGNKVNWNGKEYTVDKFQGRAVRLVDEKGNGNIVDAREINVDVTKQNEGNKAVDGNVEGTPGYNPAITAESAIQQGGKIARKKGKRGILMPDGTFHSARDVGAQEMARVLQHEAEQEAQAGRAELAARNATDASVVPEGKKRVSKKTKEARERYGLDPVEFEDERNLGEMVTDAQQATDDVLAQSAEVQRGLSEMIAEKEKDNAAIEGESTRVTDVEGRVGFEPVEGTDLDGKYAKDSHGEVRKITGVQGRRFVLDNGDIMIRRGGDSNVMDAPGKGDRVGMSAESRVNANALQSLLHDLNDTKRPLNKLREDMAAMETQVPESDRHLYAPLKGRTRATMRKELEDRMSSIAEQKESYDMSEDRGQLPKGNLIVDKRYEKDGEKMVSIIPPNRAMRIEIPESRLQSYIDKGYAKKSGGEAKRSIKDIRSDKTLDTAIDVNGKVTTRRQRIDDKLIAGFRVKTVDGKRQFTDGKSWFDESDLTKTEMDYAEKRTLENDIPDVDPMIGKKYEAFGTTFTIVGKNKNGYDAKGEDGTTDEIGPAYADKHVAEYAKKSGGAASVKAEKPSVKPASDKQGMSPEDVAVVATDFLKKFKGAQAVNMSVMQRQADMGIELPEGSVLLGFYDAGNISAKLISENLTSKAEVEALLRHEIIVHYGLRARLSKPEYDAEMDKILAADKSPALAKYFREVRAQYSELYDMSSPDAQRMMAEEVLALAAENPTILEKSNVITRALEAIRQMLVKAGLLDGRASMESVRQLIQANAEYLRNNTVNRDDVRKSLPPMQYSAPRDFAASLKKKNDIESAEVDEDIKQGMRDTMYRDDRSLFQRIKDMMADNGLTMEGLYQKGVDDLYTIAKYEKAGNNGELRQGKESAYKMAMLAKNVNSTVAVAMNHGAPVYKNGGISLNKNTKGFTEIFKPVLEMKGNMLPVWEYWAGAVRAQRLMKEGRENLYTEQQIKDIIDYVNRRPEMRKVFNQAHKDWREFNKAILDFGEQTGIVDPEQRKLFESDDYVPFYRVDEEVDRVTSPSGKRGLADQSSGIRRLKGGAGKMDILENMARNVNHMITSGYKNAAMQKVRDITINAALEEVPHNFKPVGISNEQMKRALTNLGLKVEGMTAEQMAQYSNLFTAVAPQGANIISVREGGKAKYYEVTDPQLLEAIAGVGPEAVDTLINILGWPKRMFTAAVTSTPNFVMTNFVRDVMGNYVQMAKATGRNDTPTIVKDVLTFRPFFKAFQGAMRSVRNDNMAVDYHVAGGMMGGYDNSRPESVAKNLRKLEKGGTIVNSPKKLWEVYSKLLTASEQATRMGVYEDVLKHTGDPVEAAYQSNDVLNFSRRGSSRVTKAFMAITPFLNARVQGLDRMVRGGKENPKAFMLKGALLVGATMAIMAMNADDERYWALPEHERDSFWIIFAGDTRYRIPKPFELGALFGTIPERAFEALYRDDRMFGSRMGFMLSNTFAADVPQFLKPVWEDQTNMNSFTQRPIVPQSLQRLEANQQYSTTTPEWIKDASKALPEAAPEWMRSPVRLQHMIEAYTGTVGQYIVGVTDVAYRKGTGTEKVAPAKKDFDYPVVKTFVRDGVSGDKYTDRLYQMSEKAGQTYGTLKAYKDQKNLQAYREFKTEKASVLAARKSIEKGVARMQKYNRQTKAIYANDGMSPEAKRAELDALQVKKNELAKELSDKYWMLF